MSLTNLLNSYSDCIDPENYENFPQIVGAIDTIDGLDTFTSYCLEHFNSIQTKYLVQQYTFELFNTAFTLTVCDALVCKVPQSFISFVDVLVAHAPPREVYLVAAERLLSGARISSLPLLLYTIQVSLVKMDSIDVFNAGLTMVINRSSQICTETTIALEEEEGPADADSDKEDDNMLIHDAAAPTATQLKITSTVDCVVKVLTSFARRVMLQQMNWCVEDSTEADMQNSVGSLTQEKRGVLIGFLLAILSRLVLLIDTSDDLRREHTVTLTNLLLIVVDQQPLVLLNHLRREKHHLYRTKRRGIVQQMLSGKTASANLVPESEYEQQIAAYVSQHLKSIEPVSWEHIIPNENVTDDYRAIWSSGSGGGADKYQAVKYSSDGADSTVGPSVSSSLQWSITGLAMVAGHLLNHCVVTNNTSNNSFPQMYNCAFLKSRFEVYGNILTRHSNLAVCEGLMYAKSMGLLVESIAAADVSPPMKLFLSVDMATTKGDHLLSRLIQHSYTHSGSERSAAARCEIATALLIADSTDTLTVCNNIIIAMASCHDGQRCSAAMSGLRSLLKQFEPRSLMCLLLRLIDQCPFVFISGLLFDMLKECSQAASLGLRWGQMTSPASVTAAAAAVTGSSSSSLTSVLTDKYCLSKVFRGVDEALSKCMILDGCNAPGWSQFRESGVVDLPLRNYSLSAPASAAGASDQEGGGGAAPAGINTELCGAIYTSPASSGSPFWSPLLSRSILPHLQHILKWTTVEKCLENLDVTSAVVNLILYVVMRLNSGIASDEGTGPRLSTIGRTNSVIRYCHQLDGCKDVDTTLVESVQDLIQLWRGMKLVQELIGGHILVSMEEKVKGRSNLQLTKVQLLLSNIDHCVELLQSVSMSVCWLVK